MPKPARLPQPHLHLIDVESGEVLDECPNCVELRKQLAGTEKDIRAWRTRYANLKADRDQSAREDPMWPEAIAVFRYWQERCGHPQSKWSTERFELILPYLRDYGPTLCKRAIDGAAFDPYITRRKNGSTKRHDGLELIFRSRDKFEESCNRAPRLPDPPQTDP